MVANLALPRRVSGAVKTGICDRKMIQFMPANHSNTNRVITQGRHSLFWYGALGIGNFIDILG